MVVAIDESGHDGHLLGIEGLRPPAYERLSFCSTPHVHKSPTLNGKSLHLRHAGIDGVDRGVEYHQIGMARIGVSALRFGEYGCAQKTAAGQASHTGSGQAQELPTIVAVFVHRSSSLPSESRDLLPEPACWTSKESSRSCGESTYLCRTNGLVGPLFFALCQ